MEWVVQEKTRDSYKKAVRGYLQWVVDNDDITTDLEGFDDSLLDYIQELHATGVKGATNKSKAIRTIAGLQLFFPQLKNHLSRSRQAVRGWTKRTVGRSYPPLTWELAAVLAVYLAREGLHREAIGVLLSFDCFLRVSELCRIRARDVADWHDGRISGGYKNMLIHLRITKTGNNKSVKVLDPQVQNLLRDLVGRCQPTDMLFPFTPDRFRTVLHSACAVLGLSRLYVPHSLRHGGATHYFHVLNMSMETVIHRGRWASAESARRYIQMGVAMLMEMDAPEVVKLGIEIVKDLDLYLSLAQKH